MAKRRQGNGDVLLLADSRKPTTPGQKESLNRRTLSARLIPARSLGTDARHWLFPRVREAFVGEGSALGRSTSHGSHGEGLLRSSTTTQNERALQNAQRSGTGAPLQFGAEVRTFHIFTQRSILGDRKLGRVASDARFEGSACVATNNQPPSLDPKCQLSTSRPTPEITSTSSKTTRDAFQKLASCAPTGSCDWGGFLVL